MGKNLLVQSVIGLIFPELDGILQSVQVNTCVGASECFLNRSMVHNDFMGRMYEEDKN